MSFPRKRESISSLKMDPPVKPGDDKKLNFRTISCRWHFVCTSSLPHMASYRTHTWGQPRFLYLFFFIGLGVLRGVLWRPSLPASYVNCPLSICGTVGLPTENESRGISLTLEELVIDHKEVWGRLKVFLPWKNQVAFKKIGVGSNICFSSLIHPIRNFGTPGEFDVERHFLTKKIWGRVFLNKKAAVYVGKEGSFYPIQKARERFSKYLDQFGGGEILKALVLGLKTHIPKSVQDDFIKSGLIHLLVISGQNIALLLIFLSSLLKWFNSRSEYLLLKLSIPKVNIIISSVVILFFYTFSGRDIPILRATLMVLCFLATLWHSRPHSGFYTLCFSLALILNFIPSSLLDPSFQLSFLSVGGLMISPIFFQARPLKEKGNRFRLNPLWMLFFSTLAVTMMTAPVILYHFHRLSLISIIANLVVVPYVSFILLPLAFVITFFYFIHEPTSSLLMAAFSPLSKLLIYLAHFFADLPYSSVFCIPPTVVEVIAWYGMLAALIYFVSKKRFKMGGAAVLGFCIFFSLTSLIREEFRKISSCLKVSFLSVGQGDSSLLELPGGKTMLIDAGGIFGDFDVGERLIAPYLWKRGIRRIDILVISHGDFDHIQGFDFILKNFGVGEIWLSQYRGGGYFYNILEIAEERKIPFTLFSIDSPPRIMGDVGFYFLGPVSPFQRESDNNLSLIFKCQFRNFSILFTGDIEEEVERRLVANFSDEALRATVLKVPHHGSSTSSSPEFLRLVRAKLAVISVGRNNRYHLPKKAILSRYQQLRIPIWRTDLQGTLQLTTDGFLNF